VSDPDVKLPFGKIDWSQKHVHTTGSLDDYRRNYWEHIPMHSDKLRRLCDVLHPLLPREQRTYAIFGCFAYNSYNVPRETADIDVAIVLQAFDSIEAPLRRALEPEGYEFKRISGQTFVHHGAKEKIADLVFAELNPVLLGALKHPKGTRFIHVPRLGDAWCIAPEAFIVAKFYSVSEPDRKAAKRFQDVHDMLETLDQPELQPLDLELMRGFVRLVPWIGAPEKFEEIRAANAAGRPPTALWGPAVDPDTKLP
jgi:hypothetical protein